MNLAVALAGHVGRWRFPGSARLDALLHAAPWADGGGTWLVRAANGYGREVADALDREVAAADGGRHDLRRLVLGPDDLAGGLVRGLDDRRRPDGGPVDTMLGFDVARWLADRPTVVVAGPAEGGRAAHVRADALDLHDWTKSGGGRPATLLLVDTPADPAGGDAIDLTAGAPADAVLPTWSAAAPGECWRAYIHARLAWESAGDLGRAARWSNERLAPLPEQDDGKCEAALNGLAADEYAALPTAPRTRLDRYVAEFVRRGRSRQTLLERVPDLEADGLVWRPDGTGWPQPVPWAARAMLARDGGGEAAFLLRGALLCQPLAREILGRCLDLEARERAVCWAVRTQERLEPETDARWKAYRDDPAHADRTFYPAGCPAQPRDGWSFTTFGEFLFATSPPGNLRRAWEELRLLRNGMAHGHYVCWRVVRRLMDIEAKLEP